MTDVGVETGIHKDQEGIYVLEVDYVNWRGVWKGWHLVLEDDCREHIDVGET